MFAVLQYVMMALCMALVGAVTTLTERVTISDLLRWEVNQLYCRDAKTIKYTGAGTAAAGAIKVGHPLKLVSTQWVTVLGTDEASTIGLFLGNGGERTPEALAQNAITAQKYQILIRGPAIVNKSQIPTTDPAGTALTLATIVTALAAINIYTMTEGSVSATQTT